MSDNSNSTGSSSGSLISLDLLTPQEAAVENVGPVDDGTESLGDVPSLSEDVTGIDMSRSVVCQETSPESSEGPIPSSPTQISPLPPNLLDPPDLDLESQPPVIHDIVTSSPSDNEHLGATPFVTNIDMGAPLDIPDANLLPAEPEESCSTHLLTEIPVFTEQVLDTPADIGMVLASPAEESPVFTAEPEVSIPTETLTATDPPPHVEADISFIPESTKSPSLVPESLVTESPINDSPAPGTVGLVEAEGEAAVKKEEMEPSETVTQDGREEGEEEEEEEEGEEEEGIWDPSTEIFMMKYSQQEELDSALKAVAASGDEKGQADLEKDNRKLKEELSSLPELKKELESLRSRVTELSQLTDDQEMPPTTSSSAPQPGDKDGWLKEELQRQKVLLEESKKRLQGMKKDGGDRKRVRDSLEEIQRKLSEQVERWEWKHSKEGGRRDKEEKKEKGWKSQKQNSHKEAWRKHQNEWERKKDERRMDREERRKEKPWHSWPDKNSHNHHQPHHQQPHQEQKLRRNVRPQLGCSSVEDCASKEGLYPVELPEFEELLEGYLSKLEGSSSESKDKIRKLTAEFFEDGGFIHDRVLFSDFAENVADILEDMVDVLEDGGKKDDDSLEEEMEEFEREALWKFAATA
uniref:Pre-B-cell leukemia homeobox interacting protein 1a n=1 Tax=Sander lucioperca TaxID=283035 RepID=A0A8C9YTW9_SANLU